MNYNPNTRNTRYDMAYNQELKASFHHMRRTR